MEGKILKYKIYIDFMLKNGYWSGVGKPEIDSWLNNFKENSLEEKYYIHRLLTNMIYLSEKDLVNNLKEAVTSRLHREILLREQISRDFILSQAAKRDLITSIMEKTYFTPLLINGAPHESANYLLRFLVQEEIISPSQSINLGAIPQLVSEGKLQKIIIFDDCLGSGQQIQEFWTQAQIDDQTLLKNYCQTNGIEVCYLVLFGYDLGIKDLGELSEMAELKIYCMNTITKNQNVFDENSYVWEDSMEMEKAYAFFEGVAKEFNFPILGYKNLGFAFIMHRTIPDWSLPIFWKNRCDWKPLLKRKGSND